MAASGAAAADKRRVILDAAMRVFARQGFHTCRVSDIADEAGVAYGLVYHYFSSKDEILDTLFLERWNVMLAAIAEADRTERSPRDKLSAIAGFIVDSYRYEPDLMKVIVVEVTRAANTFGRTHLAKIREAYTQIAGIVARAQADGLFRSEVTPEFGALAFYGSIEQVLTRWIFDRDAVDDAELEDAKSMIVETICRGLGAGYHGHCVGAPPRSLIESAPMTESPLVKRLLWTGLLAGTGALATLLSTRVSALIWARVFGEDPPE